MNILGIESGVTREVQTTGLRQGEAIDKGKKLRTGKDRDEEETVRAKIK